MRRRKLNLGKEEAYKNLSQMNPSLIIGLILITMGFYIVNWIFLKNKQIEKIDPEAPNSQRAAAVLFILPVGWFLIVAVLRKLILGLDSIVGKVIMYVGWVIIGLVAFIYLYDFCTSFGRVTQTHGIFWFIAFPLGTLGIIGLILNNLFLTFFLLILLFIVPAMQAEINSTIISLILKNKTGNYYN